MEIINAFEMRLGLSALVLFEKDTLRTSQQFYIKYICESEYSRTSGYANLLNIGDSFRPLY